MRVPQSWLAELLGSDGALPPVDETAEAFVRVGLEIEDLHRPPQLTGPLVVGRVLEFEVLDGLEEADPVVPGRRGRGPAARDHLRREQLHRR